MKSFVPLASILLLFITTAAGFQSALPRATLATSDRALLQSSSDGQESNSDSVESQDVVTDLDKATFNIAKQYASTGIPEDSSSDGMSQPDGFAIFLGCYIVFVIIDTIFHITPEEDYITVLGRAVRSLGGDN